LKSAVLPQFGVAHQRHQRPPRVDVDDRLGHNASTCTQAASARRKANVRLPTRDDHRVAAPDAARRHADVLAGQ
jgi:hypothetical protein